jgi:hypothetical protein
VKPFHVDSHPLQVRFAEGVLHGHPFYQQTDLDSVGLRREIVHVRFERYVGKTIVLLELDVFGIESGRRCEAAGGGQEISEQRAVEDVCPLGADGSVAPFEVGIEFEDANVEIVPTGVSRHRKLIVVRQDLVGFPL